MKRKGGKLHGNVIMYAQELQKDTLEITNQNLAIALYVLGHYKLLVVSRPGSRFNSIRAGG